MSKNPTTQPPVEDERLGHIMVKERLIAESQLNTAMDFQRAIGGRLEDLVVRLGFVELPAMEKFMEKIAPAFKGGKKPEKIPEKKDFTSPPAAGPRKRFEANEKTGDYGKMSLAPDTELPMAAAAAPSHESGRAGQKEPNDQAKISTLNETSIVLEALLRILVRKGLINSSEIKEEIRRL